MFNVTRRFQKAVTIINAIDDSKFVLLLTRILQKVHVKDEATFSEEEEFKLQSSLSLKREELLLILEVLNHILEQISYYTASVERANRELDSIRLERTKRHCVMEAWIDREKTIVNNLKLISSEPKRLDCIRWKLALSMGQSARTKIKEPIAEFDLGVECKHPNRVDHYFLDFNRDELYNFYSQLEQIQTRLDRLR